MSTIQPIRVCPTDPAPISSEDNTSSSVHIGNGWAIANHPTPAPMTNPSPNASRQSKFI